MNKHETTTGHCQNCHSYTWVKLDYYGDMTCETCHIAEAPAGTEDIAPAQGIARPSAVDLARVWLRDVADLIADPDDIDAAALATLSDALAALEIPAYLVAVTTDDDDDDDDDEDYFTTCDYCGLMNIPIIDDFAPELCESCDPGDDDDDTTGGK